MINIEYALQLLNDSERSMRSFYKHGNQSDFDHYKLLKDIALLSYQRNMLPADIQDRVAALKLSYGSIRFPPEKSSQIYALTLAAIYIEHLTLRSFLSRSYQFDNSFMEAELKNLLASITADFLQLEKDCLQAYLTYVVNSYGDTEQHVFDIKLAFNRLIVMLSALILEDQPVWKMLDEFELIIKELKHDGDILAVALYRLEYLYTVEYKTRCVYSAFVPKIEKSAMIQSMLGLKGDVQEVAKLLEACAAELK